MKKSKPRRGIFWAVGLLLLIGVGILAACGGKDDRVEILPSVIVGEKFEIVLDAHSGTPYSWSYEIRPNTGIEYVAMNFLPTNNNPGIIGGGQLNYTFQATKFGCYEIKFKLQIPWESDTLVETKIFKITIEK